MPWLPSFLGRGRLFDDFFETPGTREDWNWSLTPIKPYWVPIEIESNQVVDFNDFPCLSLLVPAFSKRCADCLRDILEPCGELLPFTSDGKDYYAYNCLKIAEVLDQEKSISRSWLSLDGSKPSTASGINWFSIIPERLEGLSIFRMRELSTSVFVTSQFAERVEENGFNGFDFYKIWPLPEGVHYLEFHKSQRQKLGLVRTSQGLLPDKGHSLIISLILKSNRMSNDEKRKIARIQDELNALLFSPRIDSLFYGSVEGRKTGNGVTKIILSCPDSNALYEKIRSWLNRLDWDPVPVAHLFNVPYDELL